VVIHQDVGVYTGLLDAGERASHALAPGRHAWVHVARGRVRLGADPLRAGDGAAVSGEGAVHLEGLEGSEVLIFDLA
jgi:hypothetical protein